MARKFLTAGIYHPGEMCYRRAMQRIYGIVRLQTMTQETVQCFGGPVEGVVR